MQRIAVIGLGRFGSRLAVNLAAAGQDVIAVDQDPRVIDQLRDRVTLAIAFDATDETSLRLHGLDKADVAVVGIGENFEANALVTVLLKQLGVPRVISRAVTPTSGRILTRIGADEVVNPEDETADRWSHRLVTPQFIKQFMLGPGYSIVEINTPAAWAGKTLMQLDLRRKARVNIVAVKQPHSRPGAPDQPIVRMPDAGEVLRPDHILVLVGADEDLDHLPR